MRMLFLTLIGVFPSLALAAPGPLPSGINLFLSQGPESGGTGALPDGGFLEGRQGGDLDAAADAYVDPSAEYEPELSEPAWMVPSMGLPPEISLQHSNNNDAIAWHDGRLFLAWRSSGTHFASHDTVMYVASSADFGRTWDFETAIALGTDVREPFFLSYKGRLFFHCFEAGSNPFAFEPKTVLRLERLGFRDWTAPQSIGDPGEIAWEFKVRYGRAWMTSYIGNHYSAGKSAIDVRFKVSDDGVNWLPVDPANPVVYHGGVSETGFEFDRQGGLWAVTRNEDGDDTGYGALLAHAEPGAPGRWEFPSKSDPWRYDSPRMFRHGKDLYLIARRDIGGPFDNGLHWLPDFFRKYLLWAKYSLRPKRTTLYKIDTVNRAVVPLLDLPSDGDTAFASILRTGPDSYLIANYTSPLDYPNRDWIWGQLSPQGTQIYFITLSFRRKP